MPVLPANDNDDWTELSAAHVVIAAGSRLNFFAPWRQFNQETVATIIRVTGGDFRLLVAVPTLSLFSSERLISTSS